MDFKLSYSLDDGEGSRLEQSHARAQIGESSLEIHLESKDCLSISFRDVSSVEKDKNYRLQIGLFSGHRIELWDLGYFG
jgi:hypothetical protein